MSVIGRIFSDRYQLKKYLGGGMSSVYLAHDIILERDVVVKLIKTDPNNLDKSKNRFLREVQSTIKLSHPNVVSVYDVDDSDEYQILVTEMIIGPTLKTYIRDNHPLSIEAVVSLSRMILNGIGHAHEAGVIHRDIKPQNILLNENNDVKITDFGIAKAMSETRMTETNQVMGSVQYISPEQAKGQNTDERTDIYSFGIVLYEMLAGDVPFHGETPVSIALKQISEEIPDITDVRDDVPVSLQNIIKKCTAKNVEDRYRHTEEVFEALVQYDTFEAPESDDDLDDDEDDYDAGAEVVPPVVAPSAGETEAVEDEQPRRRRGIGCLLFLIFFFLILLPLLYIGYIFFTDETRNYVDVPNIVGQTVEEATESLAEFELGIGDVEEIYHDEVPVDAIISASPEVGESVAPASTIDVVVSLGHAPSDMPDYVGEIYEDVADSIESFGFEEVVIEEEYTDEDNAGEIIEQSIDPDSEIYPEEETLTLVISQGIEMIEVENLIGYSESQAIEMLEEAGLEAEVVARMYSDSVQSGFVMIQTPEDGEIEIGETVELTISVGPEPPQQRAYSNTINIPYTYVATEEDDDDDDDDDIDDDDNDEETPLQIVRVYISDANHSIENVYEVFGITEDSFYTVNMTIMENSSGRYIITVDDEVIEDATVPY